MDCLYTIYVRIIQMPDRQRERERGKERRRERLYYIQSQLACALLRLHICSSLRVAATTSSLSTLHGNTLRPERVCFVIQLSSQCAQCNKTVRRLALSAGSTLPAEKLSHTKHQTQINASDTDMRLSEVHQSS